MLMAKQRESSEASPLLEATSGDGRVWVRIGDKLYLFRMDAAYHPGTKHYFQKSPWKALNFLKRKCLWWRKEE